MVDFVCENTSATFIGNINPFRYRGYYYDTETGFYYLQTRYYDPTICRFINADNYELVSQLASSKELNMYAYCRNNPIMYTDETGEGFLLAAIIVGAIIGAVVGGITAANNGAEGWEVVGGIALGAVLGAAGGALFASGSTAGYIAVRGSLLSATKLLTLKRSVALGLAIFDIIGSIAGPLLGVDWELVEWGPGTPENTPNKTPYSDISGMSTTALTGKNNIAKYYAV